MSEPTADPPTISAVAPPRHLVSFAPKRITHRFTDVLVLGTGLAGARAALAVERGRHVTMLNKEAFADSNSSWAQGGIAAVWDADDDFAAHIDDTLIAGDGLCDRHIVDLVVREAPQRVRELIAWGTQFDEIDGAIDLTREGGHSARRILHALGDATGREIMRAIVEEVRTREDITVLEGTFTIDLLTDAGACVGALTWSRTGGLQAIWAPQTVLATGGCGQLFRETTNPAVATGDGIAAAFRAGAELQDMEFVQFHPTVLYVAGSSRSLISEAVRGEGALLRDAAGVRFMPEYDDRAELAPRDVVARAIVHRMAQTEHPCVYLDQSHLDAAEVKARFPGIAAACAKLGLDFARDRIPVRPGAHYMVGGVRTDDTGATSVPGLWACGEVAATGLHGANRLASNSLIEALVFGHRCGVGASAAVAGSADGSSLRPADLSFEFVGQPSSVLDLADVRNSLQSLMFRHAGIRRDADGLAAARDQIDFWCRYVLAHEFLGPDDRSPSGWELQNMLTVAGVMVRAALARTESRGTHFRKDHPEPADDWLRHLVVRPEPFAVGA